MHNKRTLNTATAVFTIYSLDQVYLQVFIVWLLLFRVAATRTTAATSRLLANGQQVPLFVQIDALATRVLHDVAAVPRWRANDHVVDDDGAQERHDDLEPNVAANVGLEGPVHCECCVHDHADQHEHTGEFEYLTKYALCTGRTVVPDRLWLRDEPNERSANDTCQLIGSPSIVSVPVNLGQDPNDSTTREYTQH